MKIKERFQIQFLREQNVEYVKVLFWYLLLIKLPILAYKNNKEEQYRQNLTQKLVNKMKNKLSQLYVRLFISIGIPKQTISNLLIFTNVFFVIKMYNQTFILQQMSILINNRFIYDNYHIVIFQTLGIEVSDIYIQDNIAKLFKNYYTNILSQYYKKNHLFIQSQKQQPQKHYDFFQQKMNYPNPKNIQQIGFTKQIQNYLKLQEIPKKIKPQLKPKKLLLPNIRKQTPISNYTKSSSFRSKSETEIKQVKQFKRSLSKKKDEQRNSKYQQQRKKMDMMKKITQIQQKQQEVLVISKSRRQTLSLVKLGPCISKFLDNKQNKLLQVKPKFIHHPEQKIINNDYLRQLISQNLVKKKVEIQKQKVNVLDLTKPMEALSFRQIRANRQLSLRQLQKPYRYKNIIQILQRNDMSAKQYDELFDLKRNKLDYRFKGIQEQKKNNNYEKKLGKKNIEIMKNIQNEQQTQAFSNEKKEGEKQQYIEKFPIEQESYNGKLKYMNKIGFYKQKYKLHKKQKNLS